MLDLGIANNGDSGCYSVAYLNDPRPGFSRNLIFIEVGVQKLVGAGRVGVEMTRDLDPGRINDSAGRIGQFHSRVNKLRVLLVLHDGTALQGDHRLCREVNNLHGPCNGCNVARSIGGRVGDGVRSHRTGIEGVLHDPKPGLVALGWVNIHQGGRSATGRSTEAGSDTGVPSILGMADGKSVKPGRQVYTGKSIVISPVHPLAAGRAILLEHAIAVDIKPEGSPVVPAGDLELILPTDPGYKKAGEKVVEIVWACNPDPGIEEAVIPLEIQGGLEDILPKGNPGQEPPVLIEVEVRIRATDLETLVPNS